MEYISQDLNYNFATTFFYVQMSGMMEGQDW